VSEETPHNPSNQNAAESFELRPMLATREQEARNIETQPDSVQQSVQ